MTERCPGVLVSIATCGIVGYFPIAPGTAGSAVGVGLVAAVAFLPLSHAQKIAVAALLAAGIFGLGVRAAGEAEKFFGRTDPGHVVIDEVVGQMITLLAWPETRWKWLLAGFITFRALDVIKPFPAGRAEHVPGGWGIMLDDVIAGVYGLALLLILRHIWK